MFGRKQILALFWPVLLEQVLVTMIGLVNAVMVSNVGEYAVSAINLVDSLNVVIINAFIAIATGASVIVAHRIGAKKFDEAEKAGAQSLLMSAVLALFTSLILFLFGNGLLGLLFGGAEPRILQSAHTYLMASGISYPLLAIFTTCSGVLRASGDSRTPMYGSVLVNVVNAGVGAILIYGMKMEVLGASIAMVSARFSGALLLTIILIRGNGIIRVRRIPLRVNKEVLMPVLRIGIPSGVDSLIFNGGKLLVQTFVVTMGSAALAANAIAGSLYGFLVMPGNALSVVTVVIVGQCFGSGDILETKRLMKRMVLSSMMLLGGMSLVCLPLLMPLLGIYKASEEVTRLARNLLAISLLFNTVFWTPSFVMPAALRSTGDVNFTTVVSVISMWLFRVFTAWLLGVVFHWGIYGVWFAMFADWIARGAVYVGRYVSGGWMRTRFAREKIAEMAGDG